MNLGEIKKSVSKNYVNMGKDKLKVGQGKSESQFRFIESKNFLRLRSKISKN